MVVILLSSAGVVFINLVRPGILHIIEVLSDLRASTAIDTFRKFLTGVSSFEPSTMQETLCAKTMTISARMARVKQGVTYKVLLRAMLASEPQPLVDGRPQVIVMLLEEAGGPVGITSTGEWVIVPPVEQDGGGFRHVGDVRIHGVEDIHQFRLDFGISHGLNTFGPITLFTTVRIARRSEK